MKILNIVTIWDKNSTLRFIPKRSENTSTLKTIYDFHNSQKAETMEVPIKWKKDKQNVVYPHSGTVFQTKKDQTTFIHTWMNLKYVMLKKICKRPHMVWFHIYEMSRKCKSIEMESTLIVASAWRRKRAMTEKILFG